MKSPSFSIVVTTYNRKYDCVVAINSILNQTYLKKFPDLCQVIVVDDFSCPSYQDDLYINFGSRIVYLRHAKNMGLASARNSGISLATNDWFTFCDDDDSWHPDILSNVASRIKTANNLVDIVLNIPTKSFHRLSSLLSLKPTLKDMFYIGMTPPVASQFYKLSHIKDVNGYNPDILSGVDHDLWIRLSSKTLFITFSSGHISLIGKNHITRITNDTSRTAKIVKSLSIWKPTLIANFGALFYNHFEKSYFMHLIFKRFIFLFKHSPFKSFIFFFKYPFILSRKIIIHFTRPNIRLLSFSPFKSFYK